MKIGVFCEVYGTTIENRVLEHLLENKDLDVAIGDTAEELEISKPKAYSVFKKFYKKGYVKKSRIIGKTQLYILNKDNPRVQLFIHDFIECLKIEYGEKKKITHSNPVIGSVSARSV